MGPEMGANGIQEDLLVAAFYAFTPLAEADQQELLTALPPLAQAENVLGSVLIAARRCERHGLWAFVGSGAIARLSTHPASAW